MKLQQANRKNARIKMALQGPAGSGKTFSALLIAYGLTDEWSQIAVIDTENHSSELYAHLGAFQVLHLDSPFSPERYVQAISICEQAGIKVVIIDSISHEWEGTGGILEEHSNMTGNSYTNWSKLTPRHNAFVQYLLQTPLHVIGTIRTKQEYILSDKNGKQVPEKVGMKGITRDGMDYEFTLVFELNIKNKATASKDRTSLFIGKPEIKLSSQIGKQILSWCNLGSPDTKAETDANLKQRINDCKSLDELLRLFYANPTDDGYLLQSFTNRRLALESENTTSSTLTNIQNTSNNGVYNNASSNQQS